MSRGLVYTLHLWPPLAHAKHYTGLATSKRRLPERLADHALGRGARLTQVQVERGGSWVLAQTEPGWGDRERQLKQHGASRRCEVCKAVEGYQAGELSQEQALARAGWDRATEHERGLLADMFGISQPPQNTSAQPGTPPAGPAPDGEARVIPAPRPGPAAQYITPEVVALVDQLQQGWTREATPRPGAQAPQRAAEPEMEPQA
jgi:hypothetical protein